jgi:hypothetical protein
VSRRIGRTEDPQWILVAPQWTFARNQSSGVAWLAKLYVGAAELAGLDVEAATVVGYTAERDAGKPADRTGASRVLEDELVVAGT